MTSAPASCVPGVESPLAGHAFCFLVAVVILPCWSLNPTEAAIWIGSGSHVVFFIDADGTVAEDRGWLAQPTLLWEAGDLTLRLEGAATRERAIAFAESVDQ